MMIEGKGRILEHAKGWVVIYVHAALHRDSAFPFKKGKTVNIRIRGKELVIGKK